MSPFRPMKKLVTPANEAEAIALQQVLAEHAIPALVRSFQDAAFDGIFQRRYGWGTIMVAEEDYARAREIVAEWLAAAPRETDLPWQD